jgi:toxin ParE1/3/4
MIIKWSQRALSDMAHIRDYIAQDSPFYARQFTDRIIKRIENLVDFPHMERPVPEAERDDIRELIYQGYRVIYQLNEIQKHIELVSVLHGGRDLEGMKEKPWCND